MMVPATTNLEGALVDAASGRAVDETLWSLARSWRSLEQLEIGEDVDWNRLLQVATANRMQSLLGRLLDDLDRVSAPSRPPISPQIKSEIRNQIARLEQNAETMSRALRQYLAYAAEQQMDTVVLKGLWLSLKIYGEARMRPGGDIDILVRRRELSQSLQILEAMGIGRWWPNLLQDEYYARHHLHFQRSSQDLKIWFEPHWAFDHPYTTFTIDYDALIDRSNRGKLLEQPVLELAPPDLLLSLCLHLIKHAVYLPAVIDDPRLGEIVLADGMLMYFLDIHEVILHYQDRLDWSEVVDLADASGAREAMRAVLIACRKLLNTPIPADPLQALSVDPGRGMKSSLLKRIADYQLRAHRGEPRNGFWDFLLVTNGAFIVRPIRVLDTIRYLFPGKEYLGRRYGSATLWKQFQHLLGGLVTFFRLGRDTLVFGWERHRRLRKLKLNPSLFNRLETE